MDKVSNTVKWTRGPWRVGRDRETVVITRGFSEATVAECYDAAEEGFPGNRRENALLIAAAPDLYEALEAICGDGRLPSVEACERGRRALAKARGERGG